MTLSNIGLVYANQNQTESAEPSGDNTQGENKDGFSVYNDFSTDAENFGFTDSVGGYTYSDSGDAEHGRALTVSYNSTGFLFEKLKTPITKGTFLITFDIKPMTKGIYNFIHLVNEDTGKSAQGIPANNLFLTFGMKDDGFNYFPGMDRRGYYQMSSEPFEYEIGRWYNISIYGDFDKKMLYYYIDDEFYKTDQMKDSFNAIYAMRLCSYGLGNGTMTYMLDNYGIMKGDYVNIKQWIDKGHQAPNHIKSPIRITAMDMPFGNNFYNSDIAFTLNFEDLAQRNSDANAVYSVVDEHGEIIWSKNEMVTVPHGGTISKKIKVDYNKASYGLIKFKAVLTDKNTGDQSFYEEEISDTRTAERNMKIGIHSLIQNDRTQSEYAGDIMKSFEKTGFGLERSSISWITFEQQKGVYDFEEGRKIEFEQTKDLNFDRMLILSGGNPFYTSVPGALAVTDSELKGWYDYCYNVVKKTSGRYKYYEVWNEPNLIPNFNPTGVPAEGYVKLLKTAREAVLAADPDAIIVGIAQSNYGTTYISQVLEAGGGEYLDAISIHPYMWSQGPEAGMMEFVGNVRKCIDSYGYEDIPLYVSEIGWQVSVGLNEQAIYNTQMLILNEVYGYMDKIWFFRYTEAPTESNEGFGFLNSIIAQKPFLARRHFCAVANFNRLMNEVKYKKTQLSPDGLPLYEFTLKDGRSCIATWNSTDEKKNLAVDLKCEFVTVSDIYGNESTISASDNGKITFSVDKFPIYIMGDFDDIEFCDAASTVSAKEIDIVPGSKSELSIQTVDSDDIDVSVGRTENLDIESIEKIGRGKYKVIVKANDDYSGDEMIESTVTKNGNVIYSAKTLVNAVPSVTVKTNVEHYASNRWRLAVDINNNLYEKPMSGYISIQEPTEFAKRVSGRVVEPIEPGKESVIKIHIPDFAGTKDIDFKGNLVMSDGTQIDLSRVISFNGMPYMKNIPKFDAVISPMEWNSDWKLKIGKDGDGRYNRLVGDEYNGDNDLSGDIYLGWDKKNFYLAAEINDELFETDPDGRLWAGDSIQFAFSLKKESSAKRTEIGIGIGKEGPEITRASSLAPPSDGSRFIHELAVVNYPDTKKTVYELSIPWAEMFPAGFSITDYSQVLFSVLINDRDNNAREGCYEIGSGIGSSKDPSMHLEYNLMK